MSKPPVQQPPEPYPWLVVTMDHRRKVLASFPDRLEAERFARERCRTSVLVMKKEER